MDANDSFDVIVIGSGIAGASAALEAAHTGARVALVSLGETFSGSSFYGGTWGLGLVGPESDGDIDDFVATILHVGCGEANPQLVRQLVEGIDPAIRWLEQMGVELRYPTDAARQAYVPCFDYKTRGWHGLVRDSLRATWARELTRLEVTLVPCTELVDLIEQEGHVCGVVIFDHTREVLTHVSCNSLVLATGGLAGLYERRLTTDDTCGSVQGIALAHGCSLVNAEFLQMMPGIVSPVRGVWSSTRRPFASPRCPSMRASSASAWATGLSRRVSRYTKSTSLSQQPDRMAYHSRTTSPAVLQNW